MNWVKYLVNQLELDCREAQDQGYEFHFSWLLILIAFIAWEMPEGATFPDLAMAVKCRIPHILQSSEVSYPV
jgi:hypothetical protein